MSPSSLSPPYRSVRQTKQRSPEVPKRRVPGLGSSGPPDDPDSPDSWSNVCDGPRPRTSCHSPEGLWVGHDTMGSSTTFSTKPKKHTFYHSPLSNCRPHPHTGSCVSSQTDFQDCDSRGGPVRHVKEVLSLSQPHRVMGLPRPTWRGRKRVPHQRINTSGG